MFAPLILALSLIVPLVNPSHVGEHPNFQPPAALVVAEISRDESPTQVPITSNCPAPTDYVEQAFAAAFTGRQGCIVSVIRCEGWNATANYDLAHISPTSDVGPAQINQVHNGTNGWTWPTSFQSLEGNIAAAVYLHDADGWYPWKNSRHCHGQY